MPSRFERVGRVRALQLTLARAAEARAHAQVATERALAGRIAQLADAVQPTSGAAVTLLAQARYRERLHQSAQAADARVAQAEAVAARAADGARDAERDRKAVEKLIERDRADALRREMRRLEDQPHRGKRHGPC